MRINGQTFTWRKGAGWQFWWIDVPTRKYWAYSKRFLKYQAFEWVHRELLQYRYEAHLAAVRVTMYRAWEARRSCRRS